MSTATSALELQMRRIRAALEARGSVASTRAAATSSPLEDSARLARVNAHWGICSDLPYVGVLLVLFRRVLRITLRWYINPIVEQQNAFNDAVVLALYEMRAENEGLRAELARRGAAGEAAQA
jgi:hypothetical protein